MWPDWRCPHCRCGPCGQAQQCPAPRLGAAPLQACRSALHGHSHGSSAELDAGCGLPQTSSGTCLLPSQLLASPLEDLAMVFVLLEGISHVVWGPVEVLLADSDAGVNAHCGFMACEEFQQCIWARCCHPLSCMDHNTETSRHLSAAGSKEPCKQHSPSRCRCDFQAKRPRSSSFCFRRGVAASRSCRCVQVIA